MIICIQTNTEFLSNPYVSGIIGSLIAGFLSIGIIEFYKYFKLKIQHSKFNKIFGSYGSNKLYLVLPALQVRPDIISKQENEFPLIKHGVELIRSSKLLAYSDTVSLKYLLDLVSSVLGTKSIITTDEDLKNELNLSLISFGGSSSYCKYVMKQSDNRFYHFDGNKIIYRQDESIFFENIGTQDYGFIIKYKHPNFPKQIWIIIAGLGETGTKGAGWYLSQNWKVLSEKYEDKEFGLVVKVDFGYDESAILVHEGK